MELVEVLGVGLWFVVLALVIQAFRFAIQQLRKNAWGTIWFRQFFSGFRFRSQGYKRLFICGCVILPIMALFFYDWYDFECIFVLILALAAYLVVVRTIVWVIAGFTNKDESPLPVVETKPSESASTSGNTES